MAEVNILRSWSSSHVQPLSSGQRRVVLSGRRQHHKGLCPADSWFVYQNLARALHPQKGHIQGSPVRNPLTSFTMIAAALEGGGGARGFHRSQFVLVSSSALTPMIGSIPWHAISVIPIPVYFPEKKYKDLPCISTRTSVWVLLIDDASAYGAHWTPLDLRLSELNIATSRWWRRSPPDMNHWRGTLRRCTLWHLWGGLPGASLGFPSRLPGPTLEECPCYTCGQIIIPCQPRGFHLNIRTMPSVVDIPL